MNTSDRRCIILQLAGVADVDLRTAERAYPGLFTGVGARSCAEQKNPGDP